MMPPKYRGVVVLLFKEMSIATTYLVIHIDKRRTGELWGDIFSGN